MVTTTGHDLTVYELRRNASERDWAAEKFDLTLAQVEAWIKEYTDWLAANPEGPRWIRPSIT